jgi:diguanylate cyclase (GGDEF)-like protein/PAS domain S-box-containing protein
MAIPIRRPPPASAAARCPVRSPTLRLPATLGAVASVLGFVTLTAWYLHWTALLRIGPGTPPIVPNGGLALALTGAAFAGLALGERWLAVVAGGYDLAIGLLTLSEHLGGRDLGVDQLFAQDYLSAPGVPPGRMAPNTALCYLVLGMGILWSAPWRRRRRRPLWLALSGAFVVAVAVLALFGYVAGVPSAHDWSELSGMSLVAALGMMLLGSSSMLLDWGEARETVGRAQWWVVPVGLSAVVLDGFLWEALTSENGLRGVQKGQSIRATTFLGLLLVVVLAAVVWLSLRAGSTAQALRESEARYRGIMLALDEGIVVQDDQGRIVECNTAAERLIGLHRDEVTGRLRFDRRWQTMHEDGVPLPAEQHPGRVTLRTGQPFRGAVMRIRPPQGGDRWILVNAQPLIRPGRTAPYGILSSIVDITDVHRAQEEFQTLAENSPDLIVRYDRDGRRLYANPALGALYRLPTGELVGHAPAGPDEPHEPVGCEPESAALLRQKIREVFQDGHAREFEAVFRAHDGPHNLHIRLVPEYDRDGRIGDVLSLSRDVSALKRAERELAERESRYRAVVDNTPDQVLLLEVLPDGQRFRMLELNPAFERSTGYCRAQLVGRLTDEVFPPQAAAVINPRYRECAQTGVTIEDEVALEVPAGRHWYHSTLVPDRDADGRVARIVVLSRDITETREAERQVHLLGHTLDRVGDTVLLMVGDDAHFTYANEGAVTTLGYSRDELTGGMGVFDIDPDWTPDRWADCWSRLVEQGFERFETYHRTKDGRVIPVEINATLIEYGGEIIHVSVCRDVSERRAAQRALADSEECFRLAFDDSLVGMALLAPDSVPPFRHLRVNPAMCFLVDRSPGELLRLRLADLLDGDDSASVESGLQALVSGELSSYRAERRFRRTGGETMWGLLGATLVQDGNGAPLYVLSQVEDITSRKQAEARLVHRALHDDLTGLPNRALLLEHLSGALARGWRSGSRLAVLFLDLDDFKSINDRFGHGAGDEFLAEIAARISSSVRVSDIAARVGGDEFVVVCESLNEPSDAAVVADQIQRALAVEVSLQGRPVTAAASIGIAVSRDDSTPEDLLREADADMYSAKHGGGRATWSGGPGTRAGHRMGKKGR